MSVMLYQIVLQVNDLKCVKLGLDCQRNYYLAVLSENGERKISPAANLLENEIIRYDDMKVVCQITIKKLVPHKPFLAIFGKKNLRLSITASESIMALLEQEEREDFLSASKASKRTTLDQTLQDTENEDSLSYF